jgi:flagellar biogenesis protein FliO
MELAQGFTRRQETEKATDAGGLAAWIIGTLQGRVRIKWRTKARPDGRHLQTLETMSLGGKRQIVLISCDGIRYLVGCGTDVVSTIVNVSPLPGETRSAAKTLVKTWL